MFVEEKRVLFEDNFLPLDIIPFWFEFIWRTAMVNLLLQLTSNGFVIDHSRFVYRGFAEGCSACFTEVAPFFGGSILE